MRKSSRLPMSAMWQWCLLVSVTSAIDREFFQLERLRRVARSVFIHGMGKASLEKIVAYCNERLSIPEFPDFDGAWNGLQISNRGQVSRIAAAVDATYSTVEKAVECGAE